MGSRAFPRRSPWSVRRQWSRPALCSDTQQSGVRSLEDCNASCFRQGNLMGRECDMVLVRLEEVEAWGRACEHVVPFFASAPGPQDDLDYQYQCSRGAAP